MEPNPSERWAATKKKLTDNFNAAFIVVSIAGAIWLGRWAWEHRPGLCMRNLQADLTAAFAEQDPVVEKCVEDDLDHGRTLCFFHRLENGQVRTRVVRWICEERHSPKVTAMLVPVLIVGPPDSN